MEWNVHKTSSSQNTFIRCTIFLAAFSLILLPAASTEAIKHNKNNIWMILHLAVSQKRFQSKFCADHICNSVRGHQALHLSAPTMFSIQNERNRCCQWKSRFRSRSSSCWTHRIFYKYLCCYYPRSIWKHTQNFIACKISRPQEKQFWSLAASG